jgi:hypothetical protein
VELNNGIVYVVLMMSRVAVRLTTFRLPGKTVARVTAELPRAAGLRPNICQPSAALWTSQSRRAAGPSRRRKWMRQENQTSACYAAGARVGACAEGATPLRPSRKGKTPKGPRFCLSGQRLIGSIRRECLDPIVVFDEKSCAPHTEYALDFGWQSKSRRRRMFAAAIPLKHSYQLDKIYILSCGAGGEDVRNR